MRICGLDFSFTKGLVPVLAVGWLVGLADLMITGGAWHAADADGDPLTFAEAYDVDEGGLDDAQVQWRSSLDGPLGSGAELPVAGLSLGVHTITVTATDGQGASASAAVQVTVRPEDDLPPRQVFSPLIMHTR